MADPTKKIYEKRIHVRLQDLDFEFLRKMAKKHKVSISEQLRRIIKKERAVGQNHCVLRYSSGA